MSGIELHGVVKSFGSTPVLRGVDLVVPDRSVTAVLGASGSGKTTLLRVVAGFEQIDAGRVSIGGREVDDGDRSVPPQHRGVGYVPQDAALFPHLTVFGNIGFGVPRRDRARVDELVELVGLEGLARRYPHQLSGGQQQRVALARALAVGPRVVLLDEPFSSLDASLRGELRRDVARVLADAGTTAVLVTHDQDEALALADQVAVLRRGRIVVAAGPDVLYRRPPHLVAATAVGDANVLPALVERGVARCVLGEVEVEQVGDGDRVGRGRLLLRPEQLTLHRVAVPGGVGARVTDVQFHGHDALVEVEVPRPEPRALLARVSGEAAFRRGDEVWIGVRGRGRAWVSEAGGPASPDASAPDASAPDASAPDASAPDGSAPDGSAPDEGVVKRGGGAVRRPARRASRRKRLALVAGLLGAAGLGAGLAATFSGGGSSADAVGPVVFHARIDTTGRVRLSDAYTDAATAKGVSSCTAAATRGDAPSIGSRTWYAPTPPQGNSVVVEVGTIAGGYHGPARYRQSALQLGSGVLAIGQENYNLASQYARSSMTVHPDGSGVVAFTYAPGDDNIPGPGWHGGISGTISWTCTS